MKEIEQSSGSADAEMSIVAETLDYKLNNLKQTWVGIASDFGDRKVLGSLIDTLTKISELIDSIVSNKAGLIAVFSVFSGGIMSARGTGIQGIVNGKSKIPDAFNLFGLGYVGNKETLNANNIFSKGEIDAVRKYAEQLKQGTKGAEAFNNTIGKTNNQYLKDFVSKGTMAGKSAGVIANEMDSMTRSINLGAIGMGLLNTALSVIATGVITGLISGAIKLYSEWAHQVSNTADAANKLRDAFNNAKQEADDNLKTFDSLSKRFEVLSKGVDNLGHNVSLTDDEFKEYKEIVQTIANMSPELVQGYNDQNEAIIQIKDSVGALRQEYVDAQKAAYDLMITGDPNNKESGNAETILKDYANSFKIGDYKFAQGYDLGTQQAIDILTYVRDNLSEDNYKQIINEASKYGVGIGIGGNIGRFLKETLNLNKISENDIETIKSLANTYINTYERTMTENLSNVKQLFEAYLKRSDSEFYNLGEASQTIVSTMINNIDAETAEILAKSGTTAVQEWIDYQVQIASMLPSSIKGKMESVLTGSGINNAKQLEKYYDDIKYYLTEDPNGPHLVEDDNGYTLLTYFDIQVGESKDNLKKIRKRLLQYYNEEDETKRKETRKNTLEWLEGKDDDFIDWVENTLVIPNNVYYSIEELDKMYEDFIDKTKNYSDVELIDTKDTVKNINSNLKPALESVKSIYTSLFEIPTKLNLNALSKNDLTGQLESVRSQYESLGENLKIGNIDYTAFDKLTEVLSNTDSTAEQVKEAIDEVVFSFVNLSIKGNESADATIAILKNMGILEPEMTYFNELLQDSNIIYTRLKEQGLDWSKITLNNNSQLVDSYGNVIEAEDGVLSTWLKSIVGADNYKEALTRLKIAKIATNENWINSEKDINSFVNLAKTAGVTSEKLVKFQKIRTRLIAMEEALKNDPSLASSNGFMADYESLKTESENLQNEVENELNQIFGNTIEIELPDIAFVGKDLGKAVKDFNTEAKPIFDSIKDTYESIFNGDEGFDINVVTPEMLEGIRNQFGELAKYFKDTFGIEDAFDVDALENFLSVLSDGTTTAEQAQKAFNEYVTSLFYSADGLKNVSEETADAMKQMLEKSGVVNYEEVVDYMLNLQAAEEYVVQTSLDLANIKAEEIQQLVLEGAVAESTAQGIAVLALQEQLVNAESIDSSDSIASLAALAKQAGLSAEYLIRLEEVMRLFDAADAAYAKDTNTATHEMAKAAEAKAVQARDQLFKEIQEKFNQPIELDIDMPKVGGSGGGGASDAGKDAGAAYTEAYNKELEALKWLKDQNYLTEAEYLEKFRELYQKYFGDLSKYAKEYYEAEKEYYEQKIALQQKAINAAIRILERQIKEQERLRDAEKKEYEEQKKNNEKKIKEIEKLNKKIDKQIKLLQKEQKTIRKQNIEPLEDQIKSRQKVIDSINEEIELMERANDARQDEINLQKMAYELERQKHQRTSLVKYMPTLIVI